MKQPTDYVEECYVCAFCHKDIPLNYGHALVKDGDQYFCNSICYMENRMNQHEQRYPILDWLRLGGIIIIVIFAFVVFSVEASGHASNETVSLTNVAGCNNETSATTAIIFFNKAGLKALSEYLRADPSCGLLSGTVAVIGQSPDFPSPDGLYVLQVWKMFAGEQGEIYVFQIREAQST